MRATYIAILFIFFSFNSTWADFSVTDRITAINGVAVAGNSVVDTLGNTLNLTSYSATGLVAFSPTVGFTASVANPNFFAGIDVVTSTIAVSNLSGGSTLTFNETENFGFVSNPFANSISLVGSPTLSYNGSPFSSGVFLLDGVQFAIGGTGASTGGNGSTMLASATFGTALLIAPEPSSLALCCVAGLIGLGGASLSGRPIRTAERPT